MGNEARMRLTECAVTVGVTRLLGYRIAWLREQGLAPNYEVSIVKLLATETHQRMSNILANAAGLHGQLLGGSGLGAGLIARIGPGYVDSAKDTVAQGTSETQRHLIATPRPAPPPCHNR